MGFALPFVTYVDFVVGDRVSTLGPGLVERAAAVASQPIMREISWTRVFVSRALAALSRSWESLAWRQGWEEM